MFNKIHTCGSIKLKLNVNIVFSFRYYREHHVKMCDYNHMLSAGSQPSGLIDHVSSLSSNLGDLIDNSEYSDINLVVEGRQFPAHRVILAARSEYFRLVAII